MPTPSRVPAKKAKKPSKNKTAPAWKSVVSWKPGTPVFGLYSLTWAAPQRTWVAASAGFPNATLISADGKKWRQIAPPLIRPIVHGKELMAQTREGGLLVSSDGEKWTARPAPGGDHSPAGLVSIAGTLILAMRNDDTGKTRLHRSGDNGRTWKEGGEVIDLEQWCVAEGALLGFGDEGAAIVSRDAGMSWSKLQYAPSGRSRSAYAVGPKLFAVGDHGLAIRSLDGGASWSPLAIPKLKKSQTTLNGVWASADAQRIVIVGRDALVLRSEDGGGSWTRDQVPTTEDLFNAVADDAGNLVLSGAGKAVLYLAAA